MKVVHLNRKDIDKEKQLIEAGREAMRYQARLVYKNYLKRLAKYQAQQEANKKTVSGN